MASASSSVCSIFWLDHKIKSQRTGQEITERLKRLCGGNLTIYDNADTCANDIFNEKREKQIILIVSNATGSALVPRVANQKSIRSIYVFCRDRKHAEQWTRPFEIAGIATDKNDLVRMIENNLPTRKRPRDSHVSIFRPSDPERSLRDLQKESARFIWHQLLIDILRKLGEAVSTKADMVRAARYEYASDPIEQTKIDQFENEYEAARALWWYSADSFVYRLLNKALRSENIDIIFKFRFFINDLDRQINVNYQDYLDDLGPDLDHPLTMYRGQKLKMDEVDSIQQSTGGIISMNTFLSATFRRDVAEIYSDLDAEAVKQGQQSVIFIIVIKRLSKNTTPFAFIASFACIASEEEVLFTIGAIFRVSSVEKVGNKWHVRLELVEHDDPLYVRFYEYNRTQIGHGCTPLTLGWFLYRMNEFQRAEQYAQSLLDELEPDDIERGNVYNLLGLINKETNRIEDAIEDYRQALEHLNRCDVPDSPRLIAAHYNIALAYLASGQAELAHEHYEEAKKILSFHPSGTPLLEAMLESLRAKIHARVGNMDAAIRGLKQALEQKQKELPEGDPAIGSAFRDLGDAYLKAGDDRQALECLEQALDIFQRILIDNHVDCEKCHMSIGRIYYSRQEYGLALNHFEKALDIHEGYARDDEETIQGLKDYIEDTKAMLDPEMRR